MNSRPAASLDFSAGAVSEESSLTSTRRRLLVLVDGSNFRPEQSGIRTYTRELVRALASRRELELHVLTSVPEAFGDVLPGDAVTPTSPRTRDPIARALWREAHLRRHAQRLDADLVLAPVPELPQRRLHVPAVAVIHDVGPLVAPHLYGRARWLRYRLALKGVCDRAAAVVCVSKATLLALHSAVGVDPRKTAVIGEAPQRLEDGWEAGVVDDGYLLYVGSLLRHKNVGVLLRILASAVDMPDLVLTGPATEHERRALFDLAQELDVSERVKHVGFVSAAQLRALYRGAAVVVQPSLYEGFGLPVLEALAAGVPVVASDIPALREIAGDSVLLVANPLDSDEWRTAVSHVLSDNDLRRVLALRGSQRVASYSWDRTANEFLDLFGRLV